MLQCEATTGNEKAIFWYRVPLNIKSDLRTLLHRFRYTLDREWLYTQAASHTKLTEVVRRPSASISKSLCADQDDLHSLSSTRSSTDASSIAAGEGQADVCSASVPHEAAGDGKAMCGACGVARRGRAEAEGERWHTETSAQHAAVGLKHAVNIAKIVEATRTIRDEWE